MNESSLKLDPTALIDAVKNDNIDLVRKLIAQGVDVNIKQSDGRTPLMFAAGIGNIDCAKELIAKGADVNVKYSNGMTSLMYASMRNHPLIVLMICEKNVDINAKDCEGWSALNKAVGKGFIDCVKILLEKGADANTKDNDGQSALMSASQEGHHAILKLLIENGADCDSTDRHNATALMYATESGHINCVNELILCGADINIKSNPGWTALMIAQKLEKTELVKLISNPPKKNIEVANSSKQRHGFVTAWLVLMIIANSMTAINNLFASLMITDNFPSNVPTQMIIILGIIGIANIVFSVLLFKWKKLGFWGFIITSIGSLIINLSTGLDIVQSFFGMVGIALIYGVLQIKKDGISAWENLE